MEFGKAFTYLFEDEEWVTKLLIGGVLAFIPIVNLVALGYLLKVLKNVAEGVERPLPKWDDFADYFIKGVMSFLGVLVWAIPLLVLVILIAILGAVTGYNADTERAASFIVMCIWGLNCLSGLYGLFMALVVPAALTQYAVSNEFGAFFRLGTIFKYITSNLGNYIIAILLAGVAQLIASIGVILCFIGVVFTGFWASLVNSHLLGQVYRVSEQPSSEPAA